MQTIANASMLLIVFKIGTEFAVAIGALVTSLTLLASAVCHTTSRPTEELLSANTQVRTVRAIDTGYNLGYPNLPNQNDGVSG